MTETSEGSCACRAVLYRVEGAFTALFLCHCSRCRKDTGSAHGANLVAPVARLRWVTGADQVRDFVVPGTRHRRGFCAQCGGALPYAVADGGAVVVPAGSLDSAVPPVPATHICVASRAAWEDATDGAPRLDGLPP
jgi:hypothetical protein